MIIKSLSKTLLLLPFLSACQSEEAIPELPQIPDVPKHVYTVKASLPDNGQSRTHVTYGNQDIDWEVFQWHPIDEETPSNNDYLTIYNVSRLSDPECCDGIFPSAIEVKGNTATFQTIEDAKKDPNSTSEPSFYIKAGDILFVSYWDAESQISADGTPVFTINISNPRPQLVVENPDESSNMTCMQGNLKMYDIVKAVEDNKIPDIHFKHLSAIMRITLRNETGRDFDPKTLKFISEGEQNPFFEDYVCLGVDPDAENGTGLKVYDATDAGGTGNFSSYTNSVSCSINNYTAAETEKGTFIAPGESYDLYLTLVPRINNDIVSEKLTIQLEERTGSNSGNWFDMTIDNFKTVIEAGARYWFNITAVDENGEYKLMFTNKWLKDHPEQTPENGE